MSARLSVSIFQSRAYTDLHVSKASEDPADRRAAGRICAPALPLLLALCAGCSFGESLHGLLPGMPPPKQVELPDGRRLTPAELEYLERRDALFSALPNEFQPRNALAALQLGQLFLERGHHQFAREFCETALRLESALPAAHYTIGLVDLAEGKPRDAEARFRASLALLPEDARAHHRLALALAGQGKPAEALLSLKRALELDPRFTAAHLERGRLHFAEGRYAEAEAACRAALAYLPPPPSPHAARQAPEGLLDRLFSLLESEEPMAASEPRHEALYDLALCLQAQGRAQEALETLPAGAECGDGWADVDLLRAQLHLELQRMDQAAEVLAALRARFPEKAEIPRQLAAVYAAAGMPEDAHALRLAAAELDPGDRELQWEAARSALARGDQAGCVAALERIARAAPEDLAARRALAEAYGHAGLKRQGALAWQGLINYLQAHWQELPEEERRGLISARRRLGLLYADLFLENLADPRVAADRKSYGGKAQLQFLEVLKENPRDAEVHGRQGELLLLNQNYAQAEKHLREAARLAPDKPENRALLARLLQESRRPEEALREWSRVLELRPGDGAALKGQGACHRDLNQREKALEPLGEYLKQQPNDMETLSLRASLHRDLGRRQEAVADYRALLALRPGDLATLMELARQCALLGQRLEAAGMYEQLLEKHPGELQALRAAALLYEELDWPLRALYCWRRLQALLPKILETRARMGTSQPSLPTQLVEVEVLTHLAALYERLGKEQEALAQCEALAKAGRVEGLRAALAIRLRRGEEAEARDLLRRALGMVKDKEQAAAWSIELAERLRPSGKREDLLEAAVLYEQAVATRKNDFSARLALANLHLETNRLADAEDQYCLVLDAQPENAAAESGLGAVLRRRGKFEEALKHYRRALELQPAQPEIWYNLGLLHDTGLRDPKAAARCYAEYLRLGGDPKRLPTPSDRPPPPKKAPDKDR